LQYGMVKEILECDALVIPSQVVRCDFQVAAAYLLDVGLLSAAAKDCLEKCQAKPG